MAREENTDSEQSGNAGNPSETENVSVSESGKTSESSNKDESKPPIDNGSKVSNGSTENATRETESVPKNWGKLEPIHIAKAQNCFTVGVKSIPQLIVELEKENDEILNRIMQCFLAPMIPIKHHAWIIDKASHSEKCLMIASLISNFFQGYAKGFEDGTTTGISMIDALTGPPPNQVRPIPGNIRRPPGR